MKHVLLIFGGESSEHEISLLSASNVQEAINHERYAVSYLFIDKGGTWWLLDAWSDTPNEAEKEKIAIVPAERTLISVSGRVVNIDIVLAVLHGENGHEDGMVQGICAAMHVPVVGSGVGASAVCWDKLYTKQILHASGINVTPFKVVRHNEKIPGYKTISKELGKVMFVKPTVAGSSLGVTKVHNEKEFEPAMKEAFKYAPTVLVEKSIEGRELEIGVLGNPPNHKASGVGEIIPGEEFYSYEDKYSTESTAKVIPKADISKKLSDKMRLIAANAYEIVGCEGLARVDFLVNKKNEIFLNEFNTLPGFTNISQYPKLWQEEGVSYGELIERLIELAVE